MDLSNIRKAKFKTYIGIIHNILIMTQTDKEIAYEIKNKLIDSCKYIDEKQVSVKSEISKYHSNTNRNASTGETSFWVFIDVPEIPNINYDSFEDDREIRDAEKEVNEIKSRVNLIKAVCREISKQYNVDYIGENTENEGYASSYGNINKLNIRI